MIDVFFMFLCLFIEGYRRVGSEVRLNVTVNGDLSNQTVYEAYVEEVRAKVREPVYGGVFAHKCWVTSLK